MTDQKFVTVEVLIREYDGEKEPYAYNRTVPVGEASQSFVLPKAAVENKVLCIDGLIPLLLEMANADYEKDRAKLADEVVKQ